MSAWQSPNSILNINSGDQFSEKDHSLYAKVGIFEPLILMANMIAIIALT